MKCMWLAQMILVSLVCASYSEPCQWEQYLGNPGRTAYVVCSVPDSPEILWEITLEGDVNTPFIVENKVIVLCETPFSNPYSSSVKTTIAVIDLLTGTLLQKVVHEEGLAGAYPVGRDLVLGKSEKRFYEIDLSTEEVSSISEIPTKTFCFPDCYPLILSDKIVFPTTPVVCLSRDDYDKQWDFQTKSGSLYPEDGETLNIAASKNFIYVVLREDEETRIWAVDPDTGNLSWVSDSLMVSQIAVDGSILFAGGVNLYALNSKTGDLLWIFELDFIRSNIVVGPSAVYFTDNRMLYAVDKNTGKLKWQSQWEGIPFWRTYVVGAGDTIICSDIFNLTAFSIEDGTELWNVHFQDNIGLSPEKPCPAVADGIVVVMKEESSNEIMALASDPDIFVKQGDAFLSKGLKDQAISSYKKAAELYEKKGDTSRSQDVQERIHELEDEPESSLPTTPPVSSAPIPFFAVILVVVLMGIPITYYLIKHKPKNS